MDDGVRDDASLLLARAAARQGRAEQGLGHAIDDFLLPTEFRLDDRSRAALHATLSAMVAAVEGDVRRHAARLLVARNEPELAEAIRAGDGVLDRLLGAHLLHEGELMRELLARTRLDLLADTLPLTSPDDVSTASLLARLSILADNAVAGATVALMAADIRRRGFRETGRLTLTELPAQLHYRLVWWVAAAISQVTPPGDDHPAAISWAIGEAALRAIAVHDDGDRLEAAAIRLATAIDAHADERPALLAEALAARQIHLFVAVLAQGLAIDSTAIRDLVIDEDGDRLWLALRAIDLDRMTIARIGLALAEADPRRGVDRFADLLDTIIGIPPEAARAVLAPLRLPADFRAALAILGKAR